MDSTSQLIIHSHQIKLIDLIREVENELFVTLEFSSFLSMHPVADYRVAYKSDALGDITTQSFETLTVREVENELFVTLEFSSFLSMHPVADYRVAYKSDALGDITTQSFETLTVYHEAQELLAKTNIEAL